MGGLKNLVIHLRKMKTYNFGNFVRDFLPFTNDRYSSELVLNRTMSWVLVVAIAPDLSDSPAQKEGES